jgi:hypothetical protein
MGSQVAVQDRLFHSRLPVFPALPALPALPPLPALPSSAARLFKIPPVLCRDLVDPLANSPHDRTRSFRLGSAPTASA